MGAVWQMPQKAAVGLSYDESDGTKFNPKIVPWEKI
jgi:hypothetical protein